MRLPGSPLETAAHVRCMHGILFSHASEIAGPLVTSGYSTHTEAEARAMLVCQAQPGIESEIMTMDYAGEWRSAGGLTATEIVRQRWA
jgi:hypothetical protein